MNIFQKIRRDLVVLAIAPFSGFERREREKKLRDRLNRLEERRRSVDAK
jgi:hypothetical protein